MQVLIVGYGKIGRIKAFMWQSLGDKVFIHDTSQLARQRAIEDGFELLESQKIDNRTIIDISTPAEQHFSALKWCVDATTELPRYILVEKPLVSSREELEALQSLTRSYGSNLEEIIFLNESYYESAGLHKLMELIDGPPRYIEVELSKNRLEDSSKGRFFDNKLYSIGIEVPHILAVLQILNINLDKLKNSKSILYVNENRYQDQGFELEFSFDKTKVVLRSFLGGFNVRRGYVQNTNNLIRVIKVHTDTQNVTLELDPVTTLPRYHSRISVDSVEREEPFVINVADNHMLNHMQQFRHGNNINKLLSYKNALYLSSLLIHIRDHSHIININKTTPSSFIDNDARLLTEQGV